MRILIIVASTLASALFLKSLEDRCGEGFRANCCWSRVSRQLRVRSMPVSVPVSFDRLSVMVGRVERVDHYVDSKEKLVNIPVLLLERISRRRHQKYRRCLLLGVVSLEGSSLIRLSTTSS